MSAVPQHSRIKDPFADNADECLKLDAILSAAGLTSSEQTALRWLWEHGKAAEEIRYTSKALARLSGLSPGFFDEHLASALKTLEAIGMPLVRRTQKGLYVASTRCARDSVADTTLLRQIMDEIELETPVNPLARVRIATNVLRRYGATLPEPEPSDPGEGNGPKPRRSLLTRIVDSVDELVTRAERDPAKADEVSQLAYLHEYVAARLAERRRLRENRLDAGTTETPVPAPGTGESAVSRIFHGDAPGTTETPVPETEDSESQGGQHLEADDDLDPAELPDEAIDELAGIPPGSPDLLSLTERVEDAGRFVDLLEGAGVRTVQVLMKDDSAGRIVDEAYEPLDVVRAALPGYLEVSDDFHLSLIVRASGGACIARPGLVQIDDCTDEERARYAPLSFVVVETSPGNFQPWLALEGVDEDGARETRSRFFERAKEAGERANCGASGAVRMPGSRNFKPEHGPDFPVIRLVGEAPGRTVTVDELDSAGLLAPPLPSPPGSLPALEGDEPSRFPSYPDCLRRAGGDRSKADLIWADDALTEGHRTLDRMAGELASVSEKAREHRNSHKYASAKVETVARRHRYQLR